MPGIRKGRRISRKARKRGRQSRRHGRRQHGGGSEAVVFTFTNYAGFFSMFWFALAAYIYGKEKGIPMFVEFEDWQYTYQKGWHDYFTTLTDWNKDPQYSTVRKYKHTQVPDPGNPYTVRQYSNAIQEVFIPTEEIRKKADDFKATIGGEYTSLYVRRGDKVAEGTKEMALLPIDQILSACAISDDGRKVFVMTDDYQVVNEVRAKLPSCKVYTLCPDVAKGSSAVENRKKTPDEKRAHAIELITSCLVFKGGGARWADERSNVGRFLYLYCYPGAKLYPEQKEVREDLPITPAVIEWLSRNGK